VLVEGCRWLVYYRRRPGRLGPGRAGWGRSEGYDAGPGRAEKPRVHVRLGGFLRSAPCTGKGGCLWRV
jgi:hypothetical protein